MEEVVQTLAEEGVLVGERGSYRLTHHAPTLHIPTTVQGVLAARIDRFAPEEKALLQQLAVIGREFPLSLVRQVVTQPEDELYRLLILAPAQRVSLRTARVPRSRIHLQACADAGSGVQLGAHERRKVLHEHTARRLKQLYRDQLGRPLQRAGASLQSQWQHQKAIEYLQLAGQQAVQRSANAEAISHLTAALELLKTLPDTPERTQQELTLQIALGQPLMATKGYAAPEVEQAYTRARSCASK